MYVYKRIIQNISDFVNTVYLYAEDESIIRLSFTDCDQMYMVKPGGTKILDNAEKQLKEYFNGTRKDFELNIKLSSSKFDITVWNELKNVKYGNRISYKELAAKCGNPKACRAVANALGKNPLPIIIPCHRIICSDGSIGGYSFGTELKKNLLKHEALQIYK